MREKDVLKKQIIENIEKKKRDLYNNLDALEFLTTAEGTESASFELREAIRLKNSWKKKVGNYLVMGVLSSFLIYLIIMDSDLENWWVWIVILIMIIAAISFFARLLGNKIILEISSEGLTFDNYVFNSWEDIEFLYFRTKYDGNGNYDGVYLVEKLKNGFEHELMISDLPWSKNMLGRTLYQCMKRYGK